MSESGWHKPQTPGSWREPEDKRQPTTWRVSALPQNLTEQPQEEGGWHRPAADDTPYTSDDVIEIRPEDEILLPPDAQKVDTAPEDVITATQSPSSAPEPVAPEDLMYMIEHIDEQEEADDFNTVGFQELIALASLAETEISGDVVEGEMSPISPDLVLKATDGEDSEELNLAMLSPAERMMLQNQQTQILQGEVIEDSSEVDPAAYARQQMQALISSTPDVTPPADEIDDDALDPAAYARQQMQALMGETAAPDEADTFAAETDDPGAYARQQMQSLMGDADSAGDYTPPPQATEPLNPREQELARKFRATEEQVRQLRALYQAGQLTEEDFINQLRDLMILDDDQVWWMMGVETDTWYKSENNQWIEAVPPVLEKQRNMERGSRTGLGTSGDDYGSLAYLPDDAEYTPPQTDGIELDENFMPLPRQVPLDDPEATIPNQGAFRMGAQPTVPSQAYTEQTVRATPIDYNNAGIASPIESTEPPDYDAIEDDTGEEYEQAVKRRQNTLARTIALVGIGVTAITFLIGAAFVAMAVLWYNGIADQWQEQIANLRQTGS
ncbi:MAG: hypothetical protein D6711_02210, partial [Chloroflexi bacterium]